MYTLRASGGPPDVTPGCPNRKALRPPVLSFKQAPLYYTTVTLTNPNACYGLMDEPVEISLYGPHGQRAITYYGDGDPHGDVGVCCTVTLPPHGSWSIRLGAKGESQGLEDIRICGLHVEPLKNKDVTTLWQRMPDGGAITGHGSFPPKSEFDPAKFPPLPDDPTWREPCDSPAPSAAP
jgi:hypothetical protein